MWKPDMKDMSFLSSSTVIQSTECGGIISPSLCCPVDKGSENWSWWYSGYSETATAMSNKTSVYSLGVMGLLAALVKLWQINLLTCK